MAKSKLQYFIQNVEGKKPELEDAQQFLEFWNQAPPGRYVVEVKKMRKPKSGKQLGDIFGNMIDKVVVHCVDNGIDSSYFLDLLFNDNDKPTGVPVTSDFIKTCLYAANPIFDDKGNKITLRKADTMQAKTFSEASRDLLCNRICYIPEPDKHWKDK